MQLFLSETIMSDSSFVWSTADSLSFIYDTTNTYYSSFINSQNRFLWINCDYFVNQQPQTTIIATFTNAPDTAYRPIVYLVLDINAITNMWLSYPDLGWYTPAYTIPIGLTGKIVAFNVVNGVCYFCKQPITVTVYLNQSLTFQTVTEQQLITELENL